MYNKAKVKHQNMFRASIHTEPGQHLTKTALAVGVNPSSVMRDYIALPTSSKEAIGPGSSFVVGDMANNLTGTTFQIPTLARRYELPSDYRFNGGLVGSLYLKDQLRDRQETGIEFAKFANSSLAKLYRRLHMSGDIAPEDRFTGYATHVKIGQKATTITTIGDVYSWVNGELVTGAEKKVDSAKNKLIDDLELQLNLDPQLRILSVIRIVELFEEEAGLGMDLSQLLCQTLLRSIDETDAANRQTVYKPVDDIVTPWQIRELQNPARPIGAKNGHVWEYGAIDGTRTPEKYVHTVTIPTKDIDTMVVATDGSAPTSANQRVKGADDLVAVNPVYSERAIVSLDRNASD